MSDIALTAESPSASPLANEVARRRTFAIISHPDAGKTTLTEKLLLFGGAINLAGQVKAKGERRNTRSDWMKIERERGISVATSVMTFESRDCVFNLLDTPGHEDFSEDTYRTLTAVDSAVMVIDAAKGIEARTRKLFEICRLRDIPIVTFINQSDPRLATLGEEVDLVRAALPEFDRDSFNAGHLTPVYFGSAIKGIGVADLLNGLAEYGPPPRAQSADKRTIEATEPGLTALVF